MDTVKIRVLPDGRVSRADAAAYLGLAPKTLAQMHVQGRGPRMKKVAGRAFYYIRDLEAFVDTGAREAA